LFFYYVFFICSFSLLAKRKRNQKKGHFSEAFFARSKNRIYVPKIFPGLQDFLTEYKSYAGGKRFQRILILKVKTSFRCFLVKASNQRILLLQVLIPQLQIS